MDNMYFKNNSISKNTKVARDQDRVEVIKEDILCHVQDVKTVKRLRKSLSSHPVILCKFRLVSAWIKRRVVVNGG